MEGPTPGMLASLIRAIAMLALPAPHQIAWLEALGVGGSADELALEFHDGYLLVPQFVERQWLQAAVVGPLRVSAGGFRWCAGRSGRPARGG